MSNDKSIYIAPCCIDEIIEILREEFEPSSEVYFSDYQLRLIAERIISLKLPFRQNLQSLDEAQ